MHLDSGTNNPTCEFFIEEHGKKHPLIYLFLLLRVLRVPPW
jgi:hypothetical protein